MVRIFLRISAQTEILIDAHPMALHYIVAFFSCLSVCPAFVKLFYPTS